MKPPSYLTIPDACAAKSLSRAKSSLVSCITDAVRGERLEELKQLQQEFAVKLDTCLDKEGSNCLHIACEFGSDLRMIEFLLDHISPNIVKENTGMSPLMLSVSRSKVEFVELLLDRGANVNAKTSDNKFTALHIAIRVLTTTCTGSFLEVVPELEGPCEEKKCSEHVGSAREADGFVKLSKTSSTQKIQGEQKNPASAKRAVAAALLEQNTKFQLNQIIKNFNRDQLKIVRMLLKSGAEGTMKDAFGYNATRWAEESGLPGMSHALLHIVPELPASVGLKMKEKAKLINNDRRLKGYRLPNLVLKGKKGKATKKKKTKRRR